MNIISTNPSKNYKILGEVKNSTEEEIQNAFLKAREAQPKWAGLSQIERNKLIESFVMVCKKCAKEIAVAMAEEIGKPITQCHSQITESFDYFHAYMDMATEALHPEIVFEDNVQR